MLSIITISALDSMLEIDSLEADLILDEEDSYEDSIQPIPAPVWPRPDKTSANFQLEPGAVLDRDINYVADVSWHGDPKSTLDVARNGHFVHGVYLGGPKRIIMGSSVLRSRAFLTPIGEVPDSDSKIMQDSIVTDALLQMTSFSNGEELITSAETDKAATEDIKEDMDRVIAELTQAVMKSKNVTTLTRAMNKNGGAGSFRRGGKLRSSLKSLKSSFGLEAMRDLWQQTGMKTNGRKLLVDSLSEEDEQSVAAAVKTRRLVNQRIRRQKHYCGPCRLHAKLSSSSSGSEETAPPYKKVFAARKALSLTSSTELYAEVYKTSSGESLQSPNTM